MFKNLHLKKLLSFVKTHRSLDYDHAVFNAARDWRIVLISFVIFVLVVGAFNFYLFFRINRGDVFLTNPESAKIETLDRTALRQIIDTFEKRAERFSELQETPPVHP